VLEALAHLSCVSNKAQEDLVSAIRSSSALETFMRNDVFLRNTITSYCLTDNNCVTIMNCYRNPFPNEELLQKNPILQERYAEIQYRAAQRIGGFMQKARHVLLAQKQARIRLLEPHMHAWETLVFRFRYMSAKLQKQDCPICMESNNAKVVLHRERRHFTCVECYTQVRQTNACPICRAAIHTSRSKNVPQEDYAYDDYYDYHDDYHDEDYGAYDEYERELEAFRDEMRSRSPW
jgi:hypothetical protein